MIKHNIIEEKEEASIKKANNKPKHPEGPPDESINENEKVKFL